MSRQACPPCLIDMVHTIKAGVQIECPACKTKNDAILCVGVYEVEKNGMRKCIECGQVLFYTVEIICAIKEPMDMLMEVQSVDDLPC